MFLYRCTPTCIACRISFSKFSMLGPRQPALPVEFLFRNSLCWGPHPNLHIIVS
ncbi:hypothetical protein B1T34_12900 [Staphylococcus aureus]|nr:hypothetical protein B1T33_14015 [Staphylococcus aureus]PTY48045.1 hypothetical protein B1T34_12900 [Staphylococcus aureus]